MDPVSNVDRLVLLLRQRLKERSRSASTSKSGQVGARPSQDLTGLDNVVALAAIDDVDDRQLGRALLQSILAEQFGANLLNEAKFQQVISRVTETLEADPASARLLSRLVSELRAAR